MVRMEAMRAERLRRTIQVGSQAMLGELARCSGRPKPVLGT
jgi:hypothetical protein